MKATGQVVVELLGANEWRAAPPEWVRFLAAGPNKARDGRGVFTVADPDQVIARTNEFKGSIDLLVDFEHQFDRSRQNGQPAPAAAWIKELSAKGPDGTPGIWARIDWLPDTVELIRARKYRYLSAAIAHDAENVVTYVRSASLTNLPAVDTATALFAAEEESTLNPLLAALLSTLGLDSIKTEEEARGVLTPIAALVAALAKQLGVDVTAMAAMTADEVVAALSKPADQLAAGVDAVPMSVHLEVTSRLAALTAQQCAEKIDAAMKAGKLTPAMKEWAKTLSPEQLTSYLSTAPVIVAPGAAFDWASSPPADWRGTGPGRVTVETLSAEQKAEAQRFGVSFQAYCDAVNDTKPL